MKRLDRTMGLLLLLRGGIPERGRAPRSPLGPRALEARLVLRKCRVRGRAGRAGADALLEFRHEEWRPLAAEGLRTMVSAYEAGPAHRRP